MRKVSFLLFLVTVFLSIVGLFLIYESSSYTALFYIGDKFHYIKYQAIWVVAGIFLSLIVSRFNYKKLYNISLPLLLITIFLLLVVFVPGLGIKLKGAHRWIDLRVFLVQPSELLKISLTLYLAAWLSNKEKNRLFAFLILLFICVFLVAIEPDLGTALIVGATSIIVYFISGAKIPEMFFIFATLIIASLILIKVEPYRVARLASFKDFNSGSVSNTSYHVKQILIALGSGNVAGVGIGKSIQKYAYLPENTTDSIFAIYAEEMGFIGSLFLIAVLFSQIFLGFLISVNTTNKFGSLLAAGIITFIGTQTLLNLASQVVLVPLTGVPLPFISYGGSSMLINFFSIGILLNIGNKIT
ncbi:MAG: hypothetical protein A2857_03305 [Candidatus Levybacteria bacterium RIFCSPHIGHO2_01_FULL_36_15]|nr:MAG: hypothetical protein A2857_03305 [Candidatus Levybacteria bacterium RIFCSPHIGHO2_01_FULL_36_15]